MTCTLPGPPLGLVSGVGTEMSKQCPREPMLLARGPRLGHADTACVIPCCVLSLGDGGRRSRSR